MNQKINPCDYRHGGKGQVEVLDLQANSWAQANIVLVLPGKDTDNESYPENGPEILQETYGTGGQAYH